MFFSNDTRVANTATPNNFVVGDSDPNVGQYGWTKEDRGHYNQLIQYVEECRAAVDRIEELAEYVDGLTIKVAGIGLIYEDVVRIQKALREVEALIEADTTYFKREYATFLEKIGEFDVKYAEFLSKYQETFEVAAAAKASADAAKVSEGKAKTSEDAAAESAREAAEIVERGQIYRGVWDPTTNAYPDAKGTNSVWDVVLPDGTPSHDYQGKTWVSGDRLIYVKDSGEFQQVKSSSSVTSINGKSGAVILNAEDVGALEKTGVAVSSTKLETPRLIAGKPFDGTKDIPVTPSDIGAVSSSRTINGKPLTSDIALDYLDVGAWPANKVQQGVNDWTSIKGKVPCVTEAGVIELGQIIDLHAANTASDFSWRINADATLSFTSDAGGEVLRLNKSGNVGLPTGGLNSNGVVRVNQPQNPMFELQVPGSRAVANYLDDGNSWRFVTSDGNGGEVSPRFVSDGGGNFTITGNLYSTIFGGSITDWVSKNFTPLSGSLLKRNIKPATKSALDDVAQIKFHSYEWVAEGITKDRKSTQLGILAQEMEELDPSYTRDIKTFEADGVTVATSVKALDVTNMLALALKANQELMEELKVVKDRLSVLESK